MEEARLPGKYLTN